MIPIPSGRPSNHLAFYASEEAIAYEDDFSYIMVDGVWLAGKRRLI